MQAALKRLRAHQSRSPNRSRLTRWIALAVVASAASPGLVLAQTGKLGSYTGTINVSGMEVSPLVTFRATVKVSLPLQGLADSGAAANCRKCVWRKDGATHTALHAACNLRIDAV